MFFRGLGKSAKSLNRSVCHRPNRFRYRARLELLECRLAPATIKVTTVADDNTPNDGSVSLREAIQAINNGTGGADTDISNQNPGVFGVNDTINFNISMAGTVQTINVGGTGNGALPPLLKPVFINGYSEPGASANSLANGDNAKILIELNGANAGPNADGILVANTGAGSQIIGLAINRFSLNGIELQGASLIAGNFVGTNPQGNAAQPNQNDGIHISNSNSSTIGGVAPPNRNIVSGNRIDGIHIVGSTASPATDNLVQGNFVGVNASGTGSVGNRTSGFFAGTAEGNGVFGIEVSGGNANTIGGPTAAARNVIGLNVDGIEIDNGGEGNLVQGNFVGVGADGVTAVGNMQHGIGLRSDDNLSFPLGPGQANEPPVSGNVIGLNPNLGFTGLFNLVEFNGSAGVAVFGNPKANNASPIQNSGNSILGNSIFNNGATNQRFFLGIDLSSQFVFPQDDGQTLNDSQGHGAFNDPNNFQNFPVLTSAVISGGNIKISGTLDQSVSPSTQYRIEFFGSHTLDGSIPEGQSFLGAINVTSNASGHASFTASLTALPPSFFVITATATNLTPDPSAQSGALKLFNTSEFSPGIAITTFVAVGSDAGGQPQVSVFDSTGTQIGHFLAFAPGFQGGVRTAVADVNGDGVPDIIVAAGPGGGPEVKVVDGTKLNMVDANGEIQSAALLGDFFAYDPTFLGGVYVAAGEGKNFTGTNLIPVIITGAGPGGTPHVKVIDGTKLFLLQNNSEIANNALLGQFFAYDPLFLGGVRVAAADINGDGVIDVITGAGPGGGPHVKSVDGSKLSQLQNNSEIADTALINQFYAYAPTFKGGVSVGASRIGGHAVISTGAGAGAGPEVKVIAADSPIVLDTNSEPTGASLLGDFFAYDPAFGGGVSVANVDVNADGVADIITGPGPSGGPQIKVVDGTMLSSLQGNHEIADSALLDNFFAFSSTSTLGVFVGGH
jgi:CSLREA domain-containing protein